MKKIFASLFAFSMCLFVVFSAVACGNKTTTTNTDEANNGINNENNDETILERADVVGTYLISFDEEDIMGVIPELNIELIYNEYWDNQGLINEFNKAYITLDADGSGVLALSVIDTVITTQGNIVYDFKWALDGEKIILDQIPNLASQGEDYFISQKSFELLYSFGQLKLNFVLELENDVYDGDGNANISLDFVSGKLYNISFSDFIVDDESDDLDSYDYLFANFKEELKVLNLAYIKLFENGSGVVVFSEDADVIRDNGYLNSFDINWNAQIGGGFSFIAIGVGANYLDVVQDDIIKLESITFAFDGELGEVTIIIEKKVTIESETPTIIKSYYKFYENSGYSAYYGFNLDDAKYSSNDEPEELLEGVFENYTASHIKFDTNGKGTLYFGSYDEADIFKVKFDFEWTFDTTGNIVIEELQDILERTVSQINDNPEALEVFSIELTFEYNENIMEHEYMITITHLEDNFVYYLPFRLA